MNLSTMLFVISMLVMFISLAGFIIRPKSERNKIYKFLLIGAIILVLGIYKGYIINDVEKLEFIEEDHETPSVWSNSHKYYKDIEYVEISQGDIYYEKGMEFTITPVSISNQDDFWDSDNRYLRNKRSEKFMLDNTKQIPGKINLKFRNGLNTYLDISEISPRNFRNQDDFFVPLAYEFPRYDKITGFVLTNIRYFESVKYRIYDLDNGVVHPSCRDFLVSPKSYKYASFGLIYDGEIPCFGLTLYQISGDKSIPIFKFPESHIDKLAKGYSKLFTDEWIGVEKLFWIDENTLLVKLNSHDDSTFNYGYDYEIKIK